MEHKFVIAVYVDNKAGVLTRVTAMFTRRGFNIDALTVGETEHPEYSRITIAISGDAHIKTQLINYGNRIAAQAVKLLSECEKEIKTHTVTHTANAVVTALPAVYQTMKVIEKENTREASSLFFSPNSTEIRTDAPVAIMLEKANTVIMMGIMRLIAASASSPIKRPTKSPSAI